MVTSVAPGQWPCVNDRCALQFNKHWSLSGMESRMKASKSTPVSLCSVHQQTKSVNQISFMPSMPSRQSSVPLCSFFSFFPFIYAASVVQSMKTARNTLHDKANQVFTNYLKHNVHMEMRSRWWPVSVMAIRQLGQSSHSPFTGLLH